MEYTSFGGKYIKSRIVELQNIYSSVFYALQPKSSRSLPAMSLHLSDHFDEIFRGCKDQHSSSGPEPDLRLGDVGAFVVPDGLRGRARRIKGCVEWLEVTELLRPEDVVVVPDFRQDSAVGGAANVRDGAGLLGQCLRQVRQGILCRVRRDNAVPVRRNM